MPNTLYFLDVYMPNDGEPDTTLAAAVMCWEGTAGRPSVYLHTMIRPEEKIFSRVRWSNAYFYFDQRINRDAILGHKELPTLNDLLQRDYLKDKAVVCFNPDLQPYKDLTRNASRVYGILEKWQEVFADDEKASGIMRLSQMLDYTGLTSPEPPNNTYTALLYRLHSEVAVWLVLQKIKKEGRLKHDISNPAAFAADVAWPLQAVSQDKLKEASGARSFTEIRPELLRSIFSEALPDYLDWLELSVYARDWRFFRRQMPDTAQLSSDINSMAEYLFNEVLSMQMKFWVLIYYSIYAKKTDYAREIALKNGQYHELPNAVQDDFSIFLISHLDDFLSPQQRKQLLFSVIYKVLSEQGSSSFERFDFEGLQKEEEQEGVFQRHDFKRRRPENCAVYCFKEIVDRRNRRVVYRRYEISGREHDRDACAEYINQLFIDFINEAADPFSPIWSPEGLRKWVQYITGFSWQALVLTPEGNNAELDAARELLRSQMRQITYPWIQKLQDDLTRIVVAINENIDGACHRQFVFQGISVEVEVISIHKKSSFLRRMLNF